MGVIIEVIDAVVCHITPRNKEAYQIAYDSLEYEGARWVFGKFAKEKHTITQSFFNKVTGSFPTGLLPRVLKDFKRLNFEVSVLTKDIPIKWIAPGLPGISFRDDQMRLLDSVALNSRGYIKSPTGSGKTVIAGGIISMLPDETMNTLFLCHTIDLMSQAAEEFQKFGFEVVEITPDSKKKHWDDIEETIRYRGNSFKLVVASTIQTFSKLNLEDLQDDFTLIIVDETHHVVNQEGMYMKILTSLNAPARIGLTATDNLPKKSSMILEGFIGPKIGEVTIEEGIEKGFLSEPMIEWVNNPGEDELFDLKEYRRLYKEAIVDSRSRNRLVIDSAFKEIRQGKSVLIFVKEIEHGKNLCKLADFIFPIEMPLYFVYGNTEKEARLKYKKALEDKAIKCVISTTIWKEGINIKSLDCVINAAGGKSEISTLQSIGRALRTTETKNQVKIIDFVDPYKHLHHHTVMRLATYVKNGWQMRGVK